jgi:hypothetical protein
MQYRNSFRSLSPAFCLCRVPMISPRRASASLRLGVFSSTTGYRNPDGRNLSLAHLITAATASRPYPRPCADSLIQSPVSDKVASAGCKPALPPKSRIASRNAKGERPAAPCTPYGDQHAPSVPKARCSLARGRRKLVQLALPVACSRAGTIDQKTERVPTPCPGRPERSEGFA